MKLRSAFDRLVKKLPFADKLGGHLPFITGSARNPNKIIPPLLLT